MLVTKQWRVAIDFHIWRKKYHQIPQVNGDQKLFAYRRKEFIQVWISDDNIFILIIIIYLKLVWQQSLKSEKKPMLKKNIMK